jgi:spore coat protein U-like protein
MATRPGNKIILQALGGAVLSLAMVAGAPAASDIASLNITANVVGKARIEQVSALAFTSYDPTDPTNPNDAASTVDVRATRGLAYKIHIADNRTLTNGSANLAYELYTDPARTNVWGSTPATAPTFTSAGNAQTARTVYGRVLPLQDAPSGSYGGSVTVTVEW